ncbi:MAG TPA: CHAT domain-containing protein [Kofleriaceae bacterium]
MTRKILYLAANPVGTARIGADPENRAIQHELERARYRRRFELVTCWAMPTELPHELRRHEPTVVHVCCHGCRAGERRPDHGPGHRDIELGTPNAEHGLIFPGQDGRIQVISSATLAETFVVAGASVELVVLNACYTAPFGAALLPHVDSVVVMAGPIHDDAARHFSTGLYSGIGAGASVEEAFRQGLLAIHLAGMHEDAERPQLMVRDGVDPGRLVLAADPRKARGNRPPRPRKARGNRPPRRRR